CLEYNTSNNGHLQAHGDYKSLIKKYANFLKAADTKNYFELMNVPLNASVNEVEASYKNLVKIFHPDRRNRNMPKDLEEISDKCFILVGEMHQTLSNPEKKAQYLKKLEVKTYMDSFQVKEMYMTGKNNLKSGLYSSALKQFELIFNNRLAPNDTILYYLWSKKKSMTLAMNKEEQNKMKELFDSVALECRQTALFYSVKGLFMKTIGYKKQAFSCFSKALLIDPKFTMARVEKSSLQRMQKKSLKSSVMALFKKGA
ncbi:MAG: DnaJ domain-containing protein, partial [Bdellovibrionales bacterium]|nr:DnaJ domain-containing protein [Bdellovibrionales bacterium]